jgi:hypothetical protein
MNGIYEYIGIADTTFKYKQLHDVHVQSNFDLKSVKGL